MALCKDGVLGCSCCSDLSALHEPFLSQDTDRHPTQHCESTSNRLPVSGTWEAGFILKRVLVAIHPAPHPNPCLGIRAWLQPCTVKLSPCSERYERARPQFCHVGTDFSLENPIVLPVSGAGALTLLRAFTTLLSVCLHRQRLF